MLAGQHEDERLIGVVEADDGFITGYREKPTLHYRVSMGIYVYEPRALALLPAEGPCQFPDLVLSLLDAGEKVASYDFDGEWFDIGTPEEYERAVERYGMAAEGFA